MMSFEFIDTIFLDHPYACQPVCQRIPQIADHYDTLTMVPPQSSTSVVPDIAPSCNLTISSPTRETEPTFSYNTASSSSFSPPSTPQRRSLRQIERIEKCLLEKIKAENAEMLKREKEEMEAAKLSKLAEEAVALKSVETDLPEVVCKKEDTEDDENIEDSLIISFDQQEKKKLPKKRGPTPGSATGPKRKKKANENNIKVKSESDGKESLSNLETTKENVESTEVTKSTGQRSQRQRRKPKRWDDDEVEVDFSGTASELASESIPPSAKTICDQQEPETKDKDKDKAISTDEENEDEEDEDEDDPNKLWCICRQPHNNRFMIECDGCSEWFHGKCVGITKAKGSMFEKEGKKWYCVKCKSSKTPETKSPKVVVKQEPILSLPTISSLETPIALPTVSPPSPKETPKEATTSSVSPIQTGPAVTTPVPISPCVTDDPVKPSVVPTTPVNTQTTPKKPIKAKSCEGKEILAKKVVKNDNLMKIGDVLKQRKLKASGGNISSVEKKEGNRLKKLIKSSKLELKKKINKAEKTKSKSSPELTKEQDKEKGKEKAKEKEDNKWEPISKVVPLIRKQEEKKKKLKLNPIDPSFNDLFKAEPIMMPKKLGQSTPSTPTTPGALTPILKRPSIGSESSKKKSLPLGEQNCVSCGKTIPKGAIKGKESSIYCTEMCLEKHIKDSLDVIKQARAHSSNVNNNKGEKHRVNLVERSTGRLISGASAPTEDKVLEYIRLNPTFEVMKPNLIRRQSSQSSEHEKKKEGPKSTTPQIKGSLSKKKDDGNAKLKQSEVTAKTESRRDDNSVETIRHNVKKVLRETLQTRCQEADNKMLGEDIKKIAFKIEEELFNYFNKETSNKYKTRYRSLVFNLKDSKNQGLFRKVLTGSITPDRLVRMSHDELASSELAKWRERENKHALEMIKRESEAMIQQVIVKKTHKGEEVIETKASIETIDPTKEEELSKSGEVVASTVAIPELSSKEKITSNALSALDLLRDSSLDKREEEDTTDKHGQHLFDAHCKICTKKTTSDLSLSHLKPKRAASPPRISIESKTPQPKRVRVEFEAPTTRIIEEAVKASKSTKPVSFSTSESSIHESSEDLLPSSTVSSSPEAKSNPIPSCWKGFIYMAEVAKFVATAYKISGVAENRLKDVPDTITVRGRIAPEQVLDYLKKLKSTRTDIAVIQFAPAMVEDRIQYEKFFEYLNARKRYGVVGAGKSIKDFYILPLPKDLEPPEVLLPFDGPGIPTNRPNLLLGILVKNRKHISKTIVKEKAPCESKKMTEITNSTNKEQPDRSYTPPPPGVLSNNDEASNEEPYDPGRSLTPPLRDEAQEEPEQKVDEDEPYDPEENDIANIPSTSAPSVTSEEVATVNRQKISQLIEQLSKTSNPMDVTETILDTLAKDASVDKKQLTEALNKKVDDFTRQLEEQRKAAEAAFTIASKTIENNKKIDSIPGLDGSYPSEENHFE